MTDELELPKKAKMNKAIAVRGQFGKRMESARNHLAVSPFVMLTVKTVSTFYLHRISDARMAKCENASGNKLSNAWLAENIPSLQSCLSVMISSYF